MKKDWNGKRVTIIGGARQGQAAARWLVHHGAQVTVNDRNPAEEMSGALSALADISVSWVLGDHPLKILDTTDTVCLSGGVPLDNPIVVEATHRGIPLTNDTQIFMENVPCRTVGITGSAGKTTTTTLVGLMAKTAFADRVYVGGNIGTSMLIDLDKMKPDDLAILEISSFQLEQMTSSPNVAAILNITPNHLDRHGTMIAYSAVKQRILDFQARGDTGILCRDDPGSWSLLDHVNGRISSFGFSPIQGMQDGSYLSGDILFVRAGGQEFPLLRRDQIQLLGEHNLMNVLAASAIASSAGVPLDAMREAARNFHGVAHRLEFVREWKGVKWYNDSIATAPERTMAAIRSFKEPIVLLLGGRDKNLPWGELASLVHDRVEKVVIFGEASDKIEAALERAQGPIQKKVERCKNLKDGVQAAALMTKPGEVVLLSPGGTSFDQFHDFEERGEAFRKWVSELS